MFPWQIEFFYEQSAITTGCGFTAAPKARSAATIPTRPWLGFASNAAQNSSLVSTVFIVSDQAWQVSVGEDIGLIRPLLEMKRK